MEVSKSVYLNLDFSGSVINIALFVFWLFQNQVRGHTMKPLESLKRLLKLYRQNQSRKELLTMSREQLKDIGLTRCEALQEGEKWFWQK